MTSCLLSLLKNETTISHKFHDLVVWRWWTVSSTTDAIDSCPVQWTQYYKYPKKMYTKCKKITIRIIYRQISHTWYPVSLFWSSEIIKHCCPYVRYALRDTYIIIKSFISYRHIVSTHHESDDTVWVSYKSSRIIKLYVLYNT